MTRKPAAPSRRRAEVRQTLLYRVANGGLVFAPKDQALHVAGVHRALKQARTWGEFRSMIPKSEYSKVIRASFDNMCERRPKSTEKFSAESVAGWSDGDYPQWLQQDMDIYLPEEVLYRFGTFETTMLNGGFWLIPPANARPMIRALEQCGFRVESGRRVNFW